MTPYDVSDDVIQVIRSPARGPVAGAYRVFGETLRGLKTTLARVAAGSREGGAIAELPASERFGWLVAPSSTIVQPSEVHTGLSCDPAGTLEQLYAELVEPVPVS